MVLPGSLSHCLLLFVQSALQSQLHSEVTNNKFSIYQGYTITVVRGKIRTNMGKERSKIQPVQGTEVKRTSGLEEGGFEEFKRTPLGTSNMTKSQI